MPPNYVGMLEKSESESENWYIKGIVQLMPALPTTNKTFLSWEWEVTIIFPRSGANGCWCSRPHTVALAAAYISSCPLQQRSARRNLTEAQSGISASKIIPHTSPKCASPLSKNPQDTLDIFQRPPAFILHTVDTFHRSTGITLKLVVTFLHEALSLWMWACQGRVGAEGWGCILFLGFSVSITECWKNQADSDTRPSLSTIIP